MNVKFVRIEPVNSSILRGDWVWCVFELESEMDAAICQGMCMATLCDKYRVNSFVREGKRLKAEIRGQEVSNLKNVLLKFIRSC